MRGKDHAVGFGMFRGIAGGRELLYVGQGERAPPGGCARMLLRQLCDEVGGEPQRTDAAKKA
ncbi:MAG: hypothetical protein FWH34_08315 [Desulfovibrionaceae bacterium]|nr:hypothetical protein [Desulfovibrionaceae bacterium]